jgi:hypothetical protein
MAFTQEKIARASVQTQGIFNNYVYRTNDTIAQVKSAGYFDKCRFAVEDGQATNGDGWNGGNIECYCSDGYIVGQMDASAGTLTVLFSSPTVITTTDIVISASMANQIPGALGTPLKVSFGSLQVTPKLDLSAAGDFTCKVPGRFNFVFTAQAGRTGGAGVVNLFLRLVKNGVQIGNTALARIDNANAVIPLRFPVSFDLIANDVVSAFIVQDASGIAGAGGLYSVTPSTAGWATSPSAAVVVSQLSSVV